MELQHGVDCCHAALPVDKTQTERPARLLVSVVVVVMSLNKQPMRPAAVAAIALVVAALSVLCPCQGQSKHVKTGGQCKTNGECASGNSCVSNKCVVDLKTGASKSADDAEAGLMELNFVLVSAAGAVAIGILFTMGCVAIIFSGKCSGDPTTACAGRARGMDGFRTLPYVPKNFLRHVPKAPADPKDKKASTADLKKTGSIAGVKDQPPGPAGRPMFDDEPSLAASESRVDQSFSEAEPSEISMASSTPGSPSTVSMSESGIHGPPRHSADTDVSSVSGRN